MAVAPPRDLRLLLVVHLLLELRPLLTAAIVVASIAVASCDAPGGGAAFSVAPAGTPAATSVVFAGGATSSDAPAGGAASSDAPASVAAVAAAPIAD